MPKKMAASKGFRISFGEYSLSMDTAFPLCIVCPVSPRIPRLASGKNMELNNDQNGCKARPLDPKLGHNPAAAPAGRFAFSPEALAPCLADLKRQLELRQSMH